MKLVKDLIEKNWTIRIGIMKKIYKERKKYNQSQLMDELEISKEDFISNYNYLVEKDLISGKTLFGGEPVLIALTEKGIDFLESMYKAKEKILEAKGQKPNIVEALLVDAGKIVGSTAPTTVVPMILKMLMKK
jgi:predicted transcriptional regulator